MHKVAQAFLTHQYNSPDSTNSIYSPSSGSSKAQKNMRTIEIKTSRGKPIMVLQSEDTPLAIEKTLKENGWVIVSWNDNVLQLTALNILVNQANSQSTAANPTKPTGKGAAIGCLIIILLIVVLVSCSVVISGSKSKKPDVGDTTSAQFMCEEFIKKRLNAPSTAKFSQEKTTQGANPTDYTTVGFVEAENKLGGIVGKLYKCSLTYSPDTEKWTATDIWLDK